MFKLKYLFFVALNLLIFELGALVQAQSNNESIQCKSMSIESSLDLDLKLPSFSFCEADSSSVGPTKMIERSQDEDRKLIQELSFNNFSMDSLSFQKDASQNRLTSAYGSWWPSVSMSNSSILFTDIQSAENYQGPQSTSSSPSTQGTAFNPFNGSNRAKANGGSNNLMPLTSTYANYTQAYPVITLEWNFLDPTRYPKIAAKKKKVLLSTSKFKEASKNITHNMHSLINSYRLKSFQIGEITNIIRLQNQVLDSAYEQLEIRQIPRVFVLQERKNLQSYINQLASYKIEQINAKESLKNILESNTINDGDIRLQLDQMFAHFFDTGNGINIPEIEIMAWPFDYEKTYEMALLHSTELEQIKLRSGIAKDNANQEWGSILPTIGILGYMTYQYTWGSQNFAPPSQPNGAVSSSLSNYAGISVSWNIFDGYATKNMALSYEKEEAALIAEYDHQKIMLKSRIRKLLSKLEILKGQINTQLVNIHLSDLVVSDTDERMMVGIESQIDLLKAKISVNEDKIKLLSYLSEYQDNYLSLKQYTSDLSI